MAHLGMMTTPGMMTMAMMMDKTSTTISARNRVRLTSLCFNCRYGDISKLPTRGIDIWCDKGNFPRANKGRCKHYEEKVARKGLLLL